jgi:hypothetical protein
MPFKTVVRGASQWAQDASLSLKVTFKAGIPASN